MLLVVFSQGMNNGCRDVALRHLNGFTHGFISLSDRIHHPDRVHTRPYVMSQNNRVHTRPYVMSHLRCWHVPTTMHYELRIMNYEFHPTSTTVIPAPPKSTCNSSDRVHTRPYVVSHNNRVHTRPYDMSHNNRVYTRPYVVSHLRCWHVPTIMHYELRIMNYYVTYVQ